ncbi:MAG: hypothetical protein Q8R55_07300 [Candidatus Taylorbacteria bacterium]|nr:hypothetical protein [Candidatus Taylorbacteria bacterium]
MAIKTVKAMGLGAGLAAAAVGAALGSYLLTGKRAAKTKRVLRGWMLKAKGELLEQLENAGNVGEDMYYKAVDQIAGKYSKMSGVAKEEVDDMATELKKQWKLVAKGLHKAKKLAK